jgi:hypothetical protein
MSTAEDKEQQKQEFIDRGRSLGSRLFETFNSKNIGFFLTSKGYLDPSVCMMATYILMVFVYLWFPSITPVNFVLGAALLHVFLLYVPVKKIINKITSYLTGESKDGNK